jgi:hypothetical protein
MAWDMNALRSILERLQTLDAALSRACEQCSCAESSLDGQAKSKRALIELLGTVSAELDNAYSRRASGQLSEEELRFWLPPIESIRTLVRRAFGSLPTHWGDQLGQARLRVRDSSAAVNESLGSP